MEKTCEIIWTFTTSSKTSSKLTKAHKRPAITDLVRSQCHVYHVKGSDMLKGLPDRYPLGQGQASEACLVEGKVGDGPWKMEKPYAGQKRI
ncbi:unnamed protein product [Nezara viridula]|uniref:Uncharacterized protein n=1 Tax=Nezara viridula TaxID=85310 RepID=A0A9P0H7H0_NEZVI|nr:unnamed protein product [Nezara viridula]